jgi:hypothetical protein
MLNAALRSVLQKRLDGLDLDKVVGAARSILAGRSDTFTGLRAALVKAFPGADERAMGYAVRLTLPLVSVADHPTWAFPGDAEFAFAEEWIGKPVSREDRPEALLLRYLEAFGPATPGDFQTWSGLKGVAPVFEKLRPKLAVFRDERKRELFDLPSAPRPDEETPAPARFIPVLDNLLLAHADRSRIVGEAHRSKLNSPNLQLPGTFLVDGFVAGTWTSETKRGTATLRVTPFAPLAKGAKRELTEEAEQLVRFVEPEARNFEVRFD